MGSTQEITSPQSEKATSSKQELANVYLYPDWATMQGYYGPGVAIPPSYMNSAVLPSHVPHPHVWPPPQHLVPPYGVPYSTIYSPGVVYAHPAVPLVTTPVSVQLPSNSSENNDQGSTKKLKRLDGFAMQVLNNKSEGDGELSAQGASQSREQGIDASSNISDANTGVHQMQRKIDSASKIITGNDVQTNAPSCPLPEVDRNMTSSMASGITIAPENVEGKPVENDNTSVCPTSTAGAGPSFEVWIHDERQLKRERRKQANRESARRSRLRKQAETEELMEKYETLKMENMSLKSKINQLKEESEKLRVENTALMEKLNGAEIANRVNMVPDENGAIGDDSSAKITETL